MSNSRSIAEELRVLFETLTPTERKVGRVLLANYPVAGLETIAQLALRADVSGPTVLRLISKLGFDSYTAFQTALRDELEIRLQSPLVRHDPAQLQGDSDFLVSYAARITQLMQETVAHLPRVEFDGVVDLLGERKNRIWLLGGRLTDPLAAYLCHHLKVVRADVVHLRGVPSSWADSLVDMGKHDVLVIFDIRRYWDGALHIAEMAAQRKVSVLLFTDQWLSPVSRVARFTLAAHTAGPSGWDTNTPLMLLVDAVIAALNTRQWAAISDRLQEVEAMRARLGEGSHRADE
ncbi:MurR/RpiR family transcriptional regulator [Aquitalea magnusonii]|uniref:RpiR family transcriptional regulator n=1 Tax=Aquitalea magnusonii TaxID=332411 RepID=A0A318JI37_9NEIS|nr:MurR/RpiR family transcriptional regulator [Aquitalea magnusonii]PXX48379.1 RpiR family transcriptional regulator [Aquitalea magnusonii]